MAASSAVNLIPGMYFLANLVEGGVVAWWEQGGGAQPGDPLVTTAPKLCWRAFGTVEALFAFINEAIDALPPDWTNLPSELSHPLRFAFRPRAEPMVFSTTDRSRSESESSQATGGQGPAGDEAGDEAGSAPEGQGGAPSRQGGNPGGGGRPGARLGPEGGSGGLGGRGGGSGSGRGERRRGILSERLLQLLPHSDELPEHVKVENAAKWTVKAATYALG